jgi:hypothetical protein
MTSWSFARTTGRRSNVPGGTAERRNGAGFRYCYGFVPVKVAMKATMIAVCH